MSAVRGLPKAQTAYSASKAGLTAIGQGLQAEFAHSPITVSIVLPGYIETDINRGVTTALMTDTDPARCPRQAAIDVREGPRLRPATQAIAAFP